MKKEIADLWIADLRTNPPQTRSVLFDGHGYCCMGRLCVLMGLDPYREPKYDNQFIFLDHISVTPQSVVEWASLRSSLGTPSGMNDKGKSFAEIADYIEQNWEIL